MIRVVLSNLLHRPERQITNSWLWEELVGLHPIAHSVGRMSSSPEMKNCTFKPILFSRKRKSFALAIICLLGIPFIVQANDYNNQNEDHDGSSRVFYPLRVVSGFLVNFGNNINSHARRVFAPNPSHQYEQAGVRYDDQQYLINNSKEAAVQRSLTRSGYYNGPIDGSIGPMSRRAISNYQADRGMRVTGYPSGSLLYSLGL